MNDLFGVEIRSEPPKLTHYGHQKRKPTKPRGYAMPPGTGPAGETCRTCRHSSYVEHAKRYYKCGLMRAIWTGGPGTDIKLKSPACAKWEKEP